MENLNLVAAHIAELNSTIGALQDNIIDLTGDLTLAASMIGQPYSLERYKLTLPVNEAGEPTGAAHEIFNPDLRTYQDQFFKRHGSKFEFICPDAGATTSGSTYPRTELRDLTNYPCGTPAMDVLTFSVEEAPTGKTLILQQIHSNEGNSPLIKVYYRDGNLNVEAKPTLESSGETYTITESYAFGDDVIVCLLYMNGAVTVLSNRCPSFVIPMARPDTFYFKRGAYLASNEGIGARAVVLHS